MSDVLSGISITGSNCLGFAQLSSKPGKGKVTGTPIYRVVKRLKRVKEKIIEWKENLIPHSTKPHETQTRLDDLQKNMVQASLNVSLLEAEREAIFQLDSLCRAGESMYKQRSRDLAVNLGDGNSRYFYLLMRTRHANFVISQKTNMDGTTFSDPPGIALENSWNSFFV